MRDKDDEIWEFLHELVDAYVEIARILTNFAKDQEQLYMVHKLSAHLANLGVMFVHHRPKDKRPKVRKVIRDENGKISGLETLPYEK